MNTDKVTEFNYLYDLALVKLYGDKLLTENHLYARFIFMNQYSISEKNNTIGSFESFRDFINLFVCHFQDIESMIHTLTHEIRHALQFDNMTHASNCNACLIS